MTCIVGIETPNGVIMGADSFSGSEEGQQLGVASRKIVRRGRWLVAVSGSARLAQLIQYGLEWPEPPKRDLERFLVTKVVPALAKVAADKFVAIEDSHGQKYANMDMLLGVRGSLFMIHGDMTVGRNELGFEAVGAGAEVALGALHVSPGSWAPKKRVLRALQAAERWAPGVRSPFQVCSAGR